MTGQAATPEQPLPKCPYCGCGFTPEQPRQIYCSPFCEQQHAIENGPRQDSG